MITGPRGQKSHDKCRPLRQDLTADLGKKEAQQRKNLHVSIALKADAHGECKMCGEGLTKELTGSSINHDLLQLEEG